MKFELNFLPGNVTDENIVKEIRRVDKIVNKSFLSTRDYDTHGKIHSATLRRRFGTWKNVLAKAGLIEKYSGPDKISEKIRKKHSRYLTNDQILDELRRIAKLVGRTEITTSDLNEYSEIIGPKILKSRFGSWRDGVGKAGLETSKLGRRWTDDECFENILNVWTHYGRQPTYREMNLFPSKITNQGYRSRFGNWRKALEAFASKMKQDETLSPEEIEKREEQRPQIREEIKKHSVAIEDRRTIPLGIRYKILARDKFKCVRCGASPATNPTCILHVDHIKSFSKGGKTTRENLRTLCSKCNIGKSDLQEEN